MRQRRWMGGLVVVLGLVGIGLIGLIGRGGAARAADGPWQVALPLILGGRAGGGTTYLPLLVGGDAWAPPPPPTPTPSTPPPERARDQVNRYRTLAGVPPVALHDALVAAAQHHADYVLRNADDPATTRAPHTETPGKPGFTGVSSGDRAQAAGYPWAAGWEVMDYFNDPERSVDTLMATVYHRVVLLDPQHRYLGYGYGQQERPERWTWVDVFDLGRGAGADPAGTPAVVVYPADGQVGVEWDAAGETPDPIPPEGHYPVGFPVTIQPIHGTVLRVTQATLTDAAGQAVAVYPNPAGCGTTCYALIAVAPLVGQTTYTVQVVGTVDGVPVARRWSFTTR